MNNSLVPHKGIMMHKIIFAETYHPTASSYFNSIKLMHPVNPHITLGGINSRIVTDRESFEKWCRLYADDYCSDVIQTFRFYLPMRRINSDGINCLTRVCKMSTLNYYLIFLIETYE